MILVLIAQAWTHRLDRMHLRIITFTILHEIEHRCVETGHTGRSRYEALCTIFGPRHGTHA